MATIRKRGDHQYEVQVRRLGFPRLTKTFLTKRDAELWAWNVESEIRRNVFVDGREAAKWTISDLIARFKADYAPHHYKQRDDGREAWKYQVSQIEKSLGNYSLAAIDQKLISKFRDDRLKKVEGSTVRKELFMLSKILKFGESECGIVLPRGNPVSKVRKPAEGRSRDRRLTDQEWTELEKECRASRNIYLWPAVELAVETGMRQGEILGLDWADVDMKKKFVQLRDTKNGEDRAVPLSPAALTVLQKMPRSISGKVFPIQRITLSAAFQAARKRAEIEDFHYHDLRHEALSRLSERGDFSVLEIASISGHKTLTMLKRYTHLSASKLADKLATSAK